MPFSIRPQEPAPRPLRASEPELTRLHRDYAKVLRLKLLLTLLPFAIGAVILEAAELPYRGMVLVPFALVAAFLLIRLPLRRYAARGYLIGDDRLRVAKGLLFRVDTVVPFGRVQHLDVEQGPLERLYGLSTLVLHTAGTHNSSVSLPGLAREAALEMREAIRAHVRRETM